MSRGFTLRLFHTFSADQRGRVAVFRLALVVGAAVLATRLASGDVASAALVTVTNEVSHRFEPEDLTATRLQQSDECDCKIIEYVDICGKDDPSCCRAEEPGGPCVTCRPE